MYLIIYKKKGLTVSLNKSRIYLRSQPKRTMTQINKLLLNKFIGCNLIQFCCIIIFFCYKITTS